MKQKTQNGTPTLEEKLEKTEVGRESVCLFAARIINRSINERSITYIIPERKR